MRHRLSLIFTLAAWLFATGSQWDLLQTYAWGRMIATYAQRMPLAVAVEKTFSPETMCPLCHAVAEAKQQQAGESSPPGIKMPGKILLVCPPTVGFALAPESVVAGLLMPALPPSSTGRAQPATPPPRGLV